MKLIFLYEIAYLATGFLSNLGPLKVTLGTWLPQCNVRFSESGLAVSANLRFCFIELLGSNYIPAQERAVQIEVNVDLVTGSGLSNNS